VFFQDAGPVPRIHFKIKPVFLDAQVKRVILDLEGKQYAYAHGPQVIEDAQWPVPGGNSKVRIEFQGFDDTKTSSSEDGPWAWFRILDQADKQKISADVFIATFEIDGRKAQYEIRASSVVNPFFMQDLENFQCPREF
jgi:type VI secretion system protein ImpL